MAAPTDPRTTVYLVDGSNNLYRAFFAIQGLRNSGGLPTNAVFGFTGMLRKLLREQRPVYLAVAFDLPEPTFRHEQYADYKANRPETPHDLIVQIPYVKSVCQVLGVPVLEVPGFEADDVIATLTTRGRQSGLEVVIVATDKDLLQLVGEGVWMYNPVKDEFLDAAAVERVFGVRPDQVPDVLALAGDASDNIPGVPGIGDKGARDLVRKYGDLESLLREAENLTQKRQREGLRDHADSARMSRRLAVLRHDVPLEGEPSDLQVKPPDADAARRLFQELEFGTLAREFAAPVEAAEVVPVILRDADALRTALGRLEGAGRLAFSFERDSIEPMRAGLVGVALAGEAGETWYLPLGHRHLAAPPGLDEAGALRLLHPLFAGSGIRRAGHDIKGDLILMRRLGWEPPVVEFDTMLASYLLNPSRRSHDIEVVAEEIAQRVVPGYESILGSGARRVPLPDLAAERAAPVVCARVAAVRDLRAPLEEALREGGLLSLFTDLELPLAYVLADMELNGVRIDTGFLSGLARDWERQLGLLTTDIHRMAGREFNLNSPRQLGVLLFDELKLKPGRKTEKTRSYSTSLEVLEELAEIHELPRRVLEYRSLQKLKSTYVDSLPALIHQATGRVHTSFNQAVAATGRLSKQGRQIRKAFIPDPGHLLLSADYSQIELRVLAHLCGDPALVEAFRAGEDIHRRTAAEVFGLPPGEVSDEMRRRAKVVNFGIIYGMGSQRLAREQGIPLKEAEGFIEAYFRRLPKVRQYIETTIARAESEGRVRTLLQRVRFFPELKSGDRNARQQALRAAVNTTIQGSAADLIKLAMVALWRRLKAGRMAARMILQVHDELVLEVPENDIPATATLVREVMEKAYPLSVPLIADLKVGPDWLDMTRLESKD